MLLAAAPLRLSLEDALLRADRDAAAVVARAEAETASRRIGVAKAPAPPVLTLGRTRYSAREEVSVSQEIRWGGERRYAVLSARELANAAALAAARALVDARHDVRQAWFDLAVAEDASLLAEETVLRARQESRPSTIAGGLPFLGSSASPVLPTLLRNAQLIPLSVDA